MGFSYRVKFNYTTSHYYKNLRCRMSNCIILPSVQSFNIINFSDQFLYLTYKLYTLCQYELNIEYINENYSPFV